MLCLVEAVSAVHSAGWAHRDLKTDNFLFCPCSGLFWLIDFGMAERISTQRTHWSFAETAYFGACGWRGPLGFSSASVPEADTYALGCIMDKLVLPDKAVFLRGKSLFSAASESVLLPVSAAGWQAVAASKDSTLSATCAELLHILLQPDTAKRIIPC
jgi:serine/threonine protein kinase